MGGNSVFQVSLSISVGKNNIKILSLIIVFLHFPSMKLKNGHIDILLLDLINTLITFPLLGDCIIIHLDIYKLFFAEVLNCKYI